MGGAINYLLVSLVVISLVLAGANFLAWRLFERPRHALMWAVTFTLVAAQYSVNLAKSWVPQEAIFWQCANMLAFAAVLFAVWGHRDRLQLTTRWSWLTLCFVGLSLLSMGIILWVPGGMRAALAPTVAFLGMTHITIILVRRGGEPRLAQWVAAAFHQLFGLNQGLAAAIALQMGPDTGEAIYQLYALVNFALMPTLFIALGISVIFLLATDLAGRLKAMALHDTLTGLNNRRGYMAASESLWARCMRADKPLTLVLVDIDYFKKINDRYGHSLGDLALQHFAEILLDCVRAEDAVGRIGGEEFAITLGEMRANEAQVVAARIRKVLRERPLVMPRAELNLRASFGIAEWREKDDLPTLLKRADIALYEAKAAGRDTIMVADRGGLVGMVSNG